MKNSIWFAARRGILAAALILSVMLSFSGCSFLAAVTSAANSAEKSGESPAEPNILTSKDGLYSIKAPADWEIFEESDEGYLESAALSAGNELKGQGLFLMLQSKIDFADDIALEDYNNLMIEGMKSSLEDMSSGETQSLQVSGHDAKVTEISGTAENLKLVYWIYSIDFGDEFVEAVTWTALSKKDEGKQVFADVVSSLQKVEPGAGV